jgi:hypothetical protein
MMRAARSRLDLAVGDEVRHALYPELGAGRLRDLTRGRVVSHRAGLVAWPTGQTSTHALSVLRRV